MRCNNSNSTPNNSTNSNNNPTWIILSGTYIDVQCSVVLCSSVVLCWFFVLFVCVFSQWGVGFVVVVVVVIIVGCLLVIVVGLLVAQLSIVVLYQKSKSKSPRYVVLFVQCCCVCVIVLFYIYFSYNCFWLHKQHNPKNIDACVVIVCVGLCVECSGDKQQTCL